MQINVRLESNKKSIIPFALFVLASLMILAIYLNEDESGRIHGFQDGFINVNARFQSGFKVITKPASNTWTTISNFSNLLSENKKLRAEVEELKKEQLRKEQFKEENEKLRSLLEFRKKMAYESMMAIVIGAGTPYATLIVDKGLEDGIKQNMPVVVNEGLVGKIYKAAKNASIVQLITDPKSAVGAKISETGELGIVEGEIGGKLFFKYSQDGGKIKKDYSVITSGMGGIFPKDIVIGKVTGVEFNRSSQQYTVGVKPAANIAHIEQLFVITNPPESLEKQFSDL